MGSSSLSSTDVFLLLAPYGCWMWMGIGSTSKEKQGGQDLARVLQVTPTLLDEGEEEGMVEDGCWAFTLTQEPEAAFVSNHRFILGGVGRTRGAPSPRPADLRPRCSSSTAVCLLQQDRNLLGLCGVTRPAWSALTPVVFCPDGGDSW